MTHRAAGFACACALAILACGIDAVGLHEDGSGSSSGGSSGGLIDGSPGSDGDIGDGAAGDVSIDGPIDPPLPLDAKAACGRPSVYVDDFADGISSTFFNGMAPGGTFGEEGGRLKLRYGPGAVANYSAKAMVDLRDDRLRVAVPVGPPSTGRAAMSLRYDGTHDLSFVLSAGKLTARLVDGAAPLVDTVDYDPVAHRWWQIIESGGTTKWETSPDGLTWTTIGTHATPTFASTVQPILSAGDIDGNGPAGDVYFARLNAGRPVADWCKMQSFSDDFQDGQTGRVWEVIQSGACSYAESNGEVRFTMTGAGTSQCGYRSVAAYDLTSSAAYVEVPAITNYYLPVKFLLRVVDLTQNGIAEIAFIGSNELAETASAGGQTKAAYSGSADRWWRVRESAGMIYWESSSNGNTWVEKRKSTVPFPVTAVKVVLGVETNASMANSISIGTPRFNLGP